MKTSIVGRRYAKALLALADEKNQTDRIAKDLSNFLSAWEGSKELRDVFENPKVSGPERKKVLIAVLDRIVATPLTKSTLKLMTDRGRMRHVPELVFAYQTEAERRTGTVRAQVTTAKALPDAYYLELQKALEASTGKKVVIEKHEDPSIIAGVVTRVGDKVYDGSLRNRLDELKDNLLAH